MTWPGTCVALAAAAVVAGGSTEPAPLRGSPLRETTGLRLLVANNPPFVLDVESGRTTPIQGVPPIARGVVSVVGVGGRGAVVVARSARDGKLYGVRGRTARVSSLGTGRGATQSSDGRTVWIKGSAGRGCALRQVGLDGRRVGVPRDFPCGWTIEPGGSLGLVARRTGVFDPRTGRTIFKARWGVIAAAGRKLVIAGPEQQLALVDVTTGSERRLRWPSLLSRRDEPAVDPSGRYVALAFATPAWKGGDGQVLDVWLLDARTAELTHVPGMPALVALKPTSMEWTDDGRLVLLGESAERDVVAIWRPGQRRLAVKTVQLPERTNGSYSFAPLR